MVGRLAAIEDKANTEEATKNRTTRSQATTDPSLEAKLKEMTKAHKALEGRVEELESIVDQLNDTST